MNDLPEDPEDLPEPTDPDPVATGSEPSEADVEAALEHELDREMARRARRRDGSAFGQALGGALVGFDYQVFRATKPPTELVQTAKPVRGVAGEGGSLLSIDFPEDAADEAATAATDEPIVRDAPREQPARSDPPPPTSYGPSRPQRR